MNKLGEAEEDIKRIRVQHDMNLQERAEIRELVQEAKNLTLTESGDFTHIVRGIKIIRVKARKDALQEVKPKNACTNWEAKNYIIPGYNIEERIREDGRGMMMYIKDHIDYTMLDIGEDTCEVQAAGLLMEQGQATIFASVYRSPNSSKENSDNINAFIRNFSNERAYTLIAGDFNYPTIGWKTMTGRTEADIEFIEALRDGFLIQH
ncbi:hypothetical protein CAPTEDRAFT_195068, partial [Capitella teleta]